MIAHIIRKELLVNLLSLRFLSGLIVSATMMGIVGGGPFRLTRFVENAVRYRRGLLDAVIAADRNDPKSEHRYVPWWCGGNHFSSLKVDPGPAKEFHDVLPSAGEGVAAGLWDIVLLLLYSMIAFAASFWRFARQDVAPAPGM